MRRRSVRWLLAAPVLLVASCASPEARRSQGGGPGADPQNRDPVVELHGGSRMYYETPCLLPNEECPGPLPVSGFERASPEQRAKS
ncbi:MAG TPA: hypothetical protein VJ812_07950 [Gemmatimonadaceae bacterium]|nr:hypothetical protein [Gemmatimonadaceae bacterium]